MKKLIRFSFIYTLVMFLIIGLGTTPLIARGSEEVDSNVFSNDGINITVTINGLEKGDKATLILSPEMDGSPGSVIAEKVISGEDTTITVHLSIDLKDGNYQLVLDTSDKYFRTPKGYLFKVFNGEIINVRNRSIAFDLIPPSERQYNPYRGPVTVENTSEITESEPQVPGELPFRMEYFISLSLPPKQREPEISRGTKDAGWHYMGTTNFYDCEGIWGKMDVVDTGVRHGIYPNIEFTCDRVYALRWVNGYQHWMEIGWVEHSYQLDYRYLYEYDTTYAEWRLYFQVSTNIEVKVRRYSDTTWIAEWWNGSYFVQMAYEDIGFSSADIVYNSGEVYTYDGTHPSFPTAYTTISKIYVNGNWDIWDDDYDAYTDIDDDDPYYCYMISDYYYFYIYKD
jgi:hypothetical protein